MWPFQNIEPAALAKAGAQFRQPQITTKLGSRLRGSRDFLSMLSRLINNTLNILSPRHPLQSCEARLRSRSNFVQASARRKTWIPAFAGMTGLVGSAQAAAPQLVKIYRPGRRFNRSRAGSGPTAKISAGSKNSVSPAKAGGQVRPSISAPQNLDSGLRRYDRLGCAASVRRFSTPKFCLPGEGRGPSSEKCPPRRRALPTLPIVLVTRLRIAITSA